MNKFIYQLFPCLTITILLLGNFAYADTRSKKNDIKKLLSKRNILALPSLSSQVSSYTVNFSDQVELFSTPPSLKSISESPIKNIFWREIDGINVIDGLISNNPAMAYCGEFHTGNQAGQSGGLGACHMAESVGFSYATIVESGLSLCYMQNFPSKNNLKSEAIIISKGDLPTGGIEKLFSPPSGKSSRIVKVHVRGESDSNKENDDVYLEVFSNSQNKTSGDIYKANLWFCDSTKNLVKGYDRLSVSKSLKFSNIHANRNLTGTNMTSAEGFLIKSGKNLIWDSGKSRSATSMFAATNGNRFKSEIEITNENLIKLKRLDTFGGSIGKGYIITEFSGDSAQNVSFTNGAFNEEHFGRSVDGATEYNGTYYETIIESDLLQEVKTMDLSTGFYTSSLELEVDLSQFSCQTKADIEITMDLSNTTLQESLASCDNTDFRNMHFCHDDVEVRQAEENFRQMCLPSLP